jgi:hypothetical protein
VANCLCARHEQGDRLVPGEQIRTADVLGRRQAERRHRVLVLARQTENGPACDEHTQSGRRGEQLAHDGRGVVDALEVVE